MILGAQQAERFRRFVSGQNAIVGYRTVEAKRPREDVIWHDTRQAQHQFVETSAFGLRSWLSSAGQIKHKTVLLASLADEHLILAWALPIALYISEGYVGAYSHDLDELAVGTDENAALDEMRRMIAETYRLLKSEQGNLGPLQRLHWSILRGVVREV